MTRTVLDVGNCSVDHTDLEQLIAQHFDAQVIRALSAEDVFRTLQAKRVHLVLVNRRLHAEPNDGLELIRRIKASPQFSAIPVMLVSNFPEYQREAIAAGAEPGFGKSELTWPETRAKLGRFLG